MILSAGLIDTLSDIQNIGKPREGAVKSVGGREIVQTFTHGKADENGPQKDWTVELWLQQVFPRQSATSLRAAHQTVFSPNSPTCVPRRTSHSTTLLNRVSSTQQTAQASMFWLVGALLVACTVCCVLWHPQPWLRIA